MSGYQPSARKITERNPEIWKVTDEKLRQNYLYTQPRNQIFGCSTKLPGAMASTHTTERFGAQTNSHRMPECLDCVAELQKLQKQFQWFTANAGKLLRDINFHLLRLADWI